MAEATVMRNNALPYPVRGVSFTVVAPLLDADGDPISPSSQDSEVSLNGDTFTDCTNEMTEIATSSGIVYLTLTAAEMTADIVTVQLKSTGAKTTVLTLYPKKLPVLATGTCQGSNDTSDIQLASGDSAVNDIYNGCLCVAVIDGTTEARIINDYVGSTKTAEVAPAWNTAQPDSSDTYTIYLPEGRSVTAATGDWLLQSNMPTNWPTMSIAAVTGVVDANVVESNGTDVELTDIPGDTLAAGDIDGYTLEEALKIVLATCAGEVSGATTTTITIRAADDSKSRITATVDADGNRSALTLDETG